MKYLLILALAIASTAATAQTRRLSKSVICDNTEKVFKTIVEDFEETPQWQGSSQQQGTSIVLTVNLKTGTWTMVEYTTVTACVLAVGENSSSHWGTGI